MNASPMTDTEAQWFATIDESFATIVDLGKPAAVSLFSVAAKMRLEESEPKGGISDELFNALVAKSDSLETKTHKSAWNDSIVMALVGHEGFRPEQYTELVKVCSNYNTMTTLARNPSIPASLMENMTTRTPLQDWSFGLCQNPNLSEQAMVALLDRDVTVAEAIAELPKLPATIVDRLIALENSTINRKLLDSGNAPAQLVEEDQADVEDLSDESREFLKRIETVVKKDYENFSPEMKARLDAADPALAEYYMDWELRALVESDEVTMTDDLFELLFKRHVQDESLGSQWKKVLESVAKRSDLTPRQFERLLSVEADHHVALDVTENPALPESMQQELAKETTWDTDVLGSGFLYKNPSLSEISMGIILDKNPDVVTRLAARENLPQGFIDRILAMEEVACDFALILGGNMDSAFIDKTLEANPDKASWIGDDGCRLPQISEKALEIVVANSSGYVHSIASRQLDAKRAGN